MPRTTNTGIDMDIFEKSVSPQEQDVRDMEGAANEVWEAYTHLYYGAGAIGSVYFKPGRDKFAFEGFLVSINERQTMEVGTVFIWCKLKNPTRQKQHVPTGWNQLL